MGPTFSVKRIDRGWKALRKAAKEARGSYVKAGVLGDGGKRRGDSMTNVEIAVVHEFGSRTVPERSFIRSAFNAHRGEYSALLGKLLPEIYRGRRTVKEVLGILGLKMAADIKRGIVDGAGIPPPLAESTVKAKGSDRPLVDTGQLLTSITHAVVTE